MINNIINDLEELKMLFEYYKDSSAEINKLEIDLAKSKMLDIYNQIISLSENSNSEIEELKEEEEQVTEKEAEPEIEDKIEKTKETFEEVQKPQETIEEVIKESNEEKKPENISESKKASEAKIVAEKFSGKQSLNERFSGSNKDDISSSLKITPINDLKKAFGINDRFMFIKEMFNSDRDLFNSTLEHLNNFNTYDEALSYLENKFSWDNESEEVQNFISVIRRKYL